METFGRTYYESGSRAFAEHRFADAARDFQEAHNITHRPELLFNIARARESAGDLRGALEAYELFSAAGAPGYDPTTLQRDMAALRLRLAAQPMTPLANPAMTPLVTQPAPAPATAPVAAPTPVVPHVHSHAPVLPHPQMVEMHRSVVADVGPWVLVGLGGAMELVGLLADLGALSDIHTLQQVNIGAVPWSADAGMSVNRAPGEVTAGWVLGLGGAAVIGAGVAWLFARGPAVYTEPAVHAALVPLPGGAGLSVGGVL